MSATLLMTESLVRDTTLPIRKQASGPAIFNCCSLIPQGPTTSPRATPRMLPTFSLAFSGPTMDTRVLVAVAVAVAVAVEMLVTVTLAEDRHRSRYRAPTCRAKDMRDVCRSPKAKRPGSSERTSWASCVSALQARFLLVSRDQLRKTCPRPPATVNPDNPTRVLPFFSVCRSGLSTRAATVMIPISAVAAAVERCLPDACSRRAPLCNRLCSRASLISEWSGL